MTRLEELQNEYRHLIRCVRPRQLADKLNQNVLNILNEMELSIKLNAGNPILDAMKRSVKDGE